MATVQKKQSGYVIINGQPYIPGQLQVSFQDPDIVVRNPNGTLNPILSEAYGDVIDPDTDAPFDSFDALKTFALTNFFPDAPVNGGEFSSVLTVATFAELEGRAVGNKPIRFLVKDDERQALANTVYDYFPDGTIKYYAALTVEI